jgi:hypothetical protein
VFREFDSNLNKLNRYCKEQVGVLKDVSFSSEFVIFVIPKK